MLSVLKFLLMSFFVSGLSHVLHPTSSGPTLTKREEQQPSQTKPEKQLTELEISTNRNKKENLRRNHDYAEKTDETFPTSTVLQNIKNGDEKMAVEGEMTKKDIKVTSVDQLETPATIQTVAPRPLHYQRVFLSSPNASTKISKSEVKLRDVKAKSGPISEDRKKFSSTLQAATSAKTAHFTPEPISTERNDTVYTKSHTKTSSHQPQVTKTSGKPQLMTHSTRPAKTKTRKDNISQKSQKGKKETTPPTSFPYFMDDYCPPECACYGRVAQCSDKSVRQVPYGIPYNARYILLMNNHIASIQLDFFSAYESMEFLTLSNNWLTDGAIEGAFEGVPALRRLYLDRNLLQSVPVDLPDSLEELRLDNNHLRLMSEAAWLRCPGLLVLSLSNNSLGSRTESLPRSVLSPLCKLRTLNLDHNLLASVPLGLPPSIRELYLKGNRIRWFYGGVFDGTSELVVLDLSSNRLTNKGLSEDSLLNATHLESLNLEVNKLKQVPQHLPASLKTLNLEGNCIFSIKHATFSTLKNLEHLGLARNKIFKVAPGAFKALPILHQLDLCHNTLQQVPRQLPRGLSSVALAHNQIRAVPRDAFCWGGKSLSGLVRVQLEYNLIDIGKLDLQAFRCLRGFQVVHFY